MLKLLITQKLAKDEVALGKNVTFVEVGETDEESYTNCWYC